MRSILIIGTAFLAVGWSAMPPAPAKVTWEYGAANGDGVSYPGPKPIFKRAYGLGNGDGVQSGQTATTSYGYGAEGATGTMVQMSPQQPQMLAAATPAPASTSGATAGAHL